jgi:polysaccharide export outer membrane protein
MLPALLGLGGCTADGVYTTARLPVELQAPPVVNVQTIDLSRLAGPPVNNDVIERGDVIEVSIAAGLSPDDVTRIPVRVGDDGTALLPEVGPVQLAGLDVTTVEQTIAATCSQRGFYRQPQVTVGVRDQRRNRITVVGAVKEPGVHQLPRSTSYLLSAIILAGGLAEDAGPKIEIRYPTGDSALAGSPPAEPGPNGVQLTGMNAPSGGGVAYVCLNLTDSSLREPGGRYLPDGSVITVEKRQPQPYHVIGLVQKPGEFEFPQNRELRLLGAIAQAGGTSLGLADKIYVIRPKPDGSGDAIIQVSLRRAKRTQEENLRLQPGDVVSVEDTPATVLVQTIREARIGLGASIPLF